MKVMKIQFRVLLTVLFCSLAVFSCNKDNTITPDEDLQLQTNEQEFVRLMNARATYSGATFEITNVARDGKLLKIEVEGGCEESDYKIVWNGILLQSYPEQTGLVVTYEGPKEEVCAGSNTHTLVVDMEKLFGRTDIIVHVANGSKVADVSIDPDGSVSNKP